MKKLVWIKIYQAHCEIFYDHSIGTPKGNWKDGSKEKRGRNRPIFEKEKTIDQLFKNSLECFVSVAKR